MEITKRLLVGANHFSSRSVVCVRHPLPFPGDRDERLRHFFDQLCAFVCHRDLDRSGSRVAGDASLSGELLVAASAVVLQRKVGIEVLRFGFNQISGEVWFEISDTREGEITADLIVGLADELLRASPELTDREIEERLEATTDAVYKAMPDRFANRVIAAIDRRGLSWRRWQHPVLRKQSAALLDLEVGVGARARWFRKSFFDIEGQLAHEMTDDKLGTALFLCRQGISTPTQRICRSFAEAGEAVAALGYPVVVKPRSEGAGRAVTVDVRDSRALEAAYSQAAQYFGGVIVEQFFPGRDYRFLVIRGKLYGCSWRRPATVIGDGTRSIVQLVAAVNEDPRRGPNSRHVFQEIDIDKLDEKETTPYRTMGYTLESVPKEGEEVRLSYASLRNEGCTYHDMTAEVHPSYVSLAERIARLTGVWACGLDVIAEDITVPVDQGHYCINEVNTYPALNLNEFGEREDKPGEILLSSVFPDDKDASVPVIALISEESQVELASCLARELSGESRRVAVAGSSGFTVDGVCYEEGDFANLEGALRVFGERSADVIILERRPVELVSRGFGLGHFDLVVFVPPSSSAGADDFWRMAGYLADHADHARLIGEETLQAIPKVAPADKVAVVALARNIVKERES